MTITLTITLTITITSTIYYYYLLLLLLLLFIIITSTIRCVLTALAWTVSSNLSAAIELSHGVSPQFSKPSFRVERPPIAFKSSSGVERIRIWPRIRALA